MTQRQYQIGNPVKCLDGFKDHAFQYGRVTRVLSGYCFEVTFKDGEKEDVLAHYLRIAVEEDAS